MQFELRRFWLAAIVLPLPDCRVFWRQLLLLQIFQLQLLLMVRIYRQLWTEQLLLPQIPVPAGMLGLASTGSQWLLLRGVLIRVVRLTLRAVEHPGLGLRAAKFARQRLLSGVLANRSIGAGQLASSQ